MINMKNSKWYKEKKKNLLILRLPWRLLLWIGRYMTIQTGNCIYTLYSLKVYINYIRHEIVDLKRSGPGLFPMSGVFCSIYQLYPTWDSWSEMFWSWPVPSERCFLRLVTSSVPESMTGHGKKVCPLWQLPESPPEFFFPPCRSWSSVN